MGHLEKMKQFQLVDNYRSRLLPKDHPILRWKFLDLKRTQTRSFPFLSPLDHVLRPQTKVGSGGGNSSNSDDGELDEDIDIWEMANSEQTPLMTMQDFLSDLQSLSKKIRAVRAFQTKTKGDADSAPKSLWISREDCNNMWWTSEFQGISLNGSFRDPRMQASGGPDHKFLFLFPHNQLVAKCFLDESS